MCDLRHGAMVPQLEAFRDMLIAEGVAHWRLFSIFPMGRAKNDPSLRMTDAQFREMLEFIRRTRKEGRIGTSYACEGFLGDYETEVRDYFYQCAAGVSVASIRVDGAISGCTSIRANFHQGNIYRDKFWDVWQNRFEPFRNRDWARRGACADCKMVPLLSGRRHAPPRRRRRTAVLPLPPTVDTPYRNYHPDMLLRIVTRSLPHICRERRSKPALGSGFCRLTALRQHFRRRIAAYCLRVNLKLSRSGR